MPFQLEQTEYRTGTRAGRRRVLGDVGDRQEAADALASGAILGAAFGNFYALLSLADEATVRAVNLRKGRPAGQVGSIIGPPTVLPAVWALDQLPPPLRRGRALTVVDALWRLGPFGFRGPAQAHVPPHLRAVDAGVPTAQVIGPGHACPSHDLVARALRATGDGLLHVTSANRSRHAIGADDSPAHWRADGLAAEFGGEPGFFLLEHDDEDVARRRHPAHLPVSTSVLALHRTVAVPGDPRPHLVLERHGSLHAEAVRAVLAELGFGLLLGPGSTTRLRPRTYADR